MGNLQASASSSTPSSEEKYDVFLSFRGKDIRDGFANTLREALKVKHIKAFMDDELPKGERISQLFKTIEESKISIVIFSENYGSSEWCLNELVKIMECKKINKQTVKPVFYGVKPSAVREDSFVKLKEKFPEEVPKWKEALIDASSLVGWESSVTRPETKLVNAIVDDICKKLIGENILSPSDFRGLIGVDERIKQIKSLLCLHKTDVRTIGIWGMGGIGKTTLAEVVFNQISGHQFEGVCFIENVREKLENGGGLDCLQKNILADVLKDKKLEDGSSTIPLIIKKRLNQTKVFIVLDDVDDFIRLETLARRVDGLGQGSRIIITSRDKLVLQNCGVNVQNIYEVEEFNSHEALQLFCKRAFKQNQPTEDLMKLSYDIVNYARGNPLALTVLGSSLYQKSTKVWESAINKLRTNVDRKIFDVLKISYDGLNAGEQDIFLDIACFLKGKSQDYVATILDDCEHSLSVLIDKSLITVSTHGLIEMHDLLQDLGRDIVHKESPKNPGKRSRLWRQEDVRDTLKHGDGTKAVRGIFLDMSEMKDMHLSLEAFNKLYNLRLLKFYDSKRRDTKMYNNWLRKFYGYSNKDTQSFNKVHFREGQNDAPPFEKLTSFIWFGYPFAALSSKFDLENLVELDLSCSRNLKRLWEDTEHAPKLKWLDLHDCPSLIEVPDLSKSPFLKKIDLGSCSHLAKIQNLSNLAFLEKIDLYDCSYLTEIPDLSGSPLLKTIDLEGCRSLLDFPLLAVCASCPRDMNLSGLESLRSFPSTIVLHYEDLEFLDLSNCIKLTTFPQVFGNITRLDLSGTAIDEVPPSIEFLIKLYRLDLPKCTRLISTKICKLKSLKKLDLENCSQLESFPEILEKMEGLKILNLSGTAIKKLPHSIEHLTNLLDLYLRRCKNLESLPRSISNLASLQRLFISDCPKLEILQDNLGNLKSSLEFLELSGNNFESLPKSMKQLYKLTSLNVDNCNMLQSLTDLPSALKFLSASGCNMLQSLTALPSALKYLSASGCKQLRSIPDASEFANLGEAEFIFSNCLNLEETVGNMLKTLKEGYKEGDEINKLTFICPGSKVPEWFKYRTEGSSIVEFQMPRHDCFLGFVVCAVIAFGKNCFIDKNLRVGYKYRCSSPNIHQSVGKGFIRVGYWSTLIDSDHIAFGVCETYPRVSKCDFTNCSIEYKLYNEHSGEKNPNCRIKSFGVCPIYAKLN